MFSRSVWYSTPCIRLWYQRLKMRPSRCVLALQGRPASRCCSGHDKRVVIDVWRLQLWDYESGQFERTLKGHTNAVQWLCFDKTGSLLGAATVRRSHPHPGHSPVPLVVPQRRAPQT